MSFTEINRSEATTGQIIQFPIVPRNMPLSRPVKKYKPIFKNAIRKILNVREFRTGEYVCLSDGTCGFIMDVRVGFGVKKRNLYHILLDNGRWRMVYAKSMKHEDRATC